MTTLTVDEHGCLNPGLCPNCLLHAAFTHVVSNFIWPTRVVPTEMTGRPLEQNSLWVLENIHKCLHCSKTVTMHRTRRWTAECGWETESMRQVWPEATPRQLGDDVPELIRELFTEASKAENTGAMRLAGVGYRAVVEEICKQQGATKHNLYDRIQELKNGGLPQSTVDALHEARIVGNESIHYALEFSAEEIADIAALIAEVCLVLYVQPAERARMAAQRQAKVSARKAAQP
ncbi:DUF4145 domain-containing protein [Kitasatospora cineracea]